MPMEQLSPHHLTPGSHLFSIEWQVLKFMMPGFRLMVFLLSLLRRCRALQLAPSTTAT